MSDSRPPYHRRQTRPIPRVELPPVAPAPDAARDAETMVQCPVCGEMMTTAQYAEMKYAHATIHVAHDDAAPDDPKPAA